LRRLVPDGARKGELGIFRCAGAQHSLASATRQKHIPLNQYISLDKPIYDDDSVRTLLEVAGG
jgi:hypothetical protein